MKRSTFLATLATLAIAGAHAQQAGPFPAPDGALGRAPWLDPSLPLPATSVRPKSVSSVGAIDTSNRAAVVAAYNTYFNVAAPALGFTGSLSGCNPGTISTAYQEWFVTRINYLRAMAGVPGNMAIDATLNAQEQAASLIFAANGLLAHFPSSNLTCYSQAGYSGASTSNIALFSPASGDALPLYMSDYGNGNQEAGHRRWILHSAHSTFAVGQAVVGSTVGNALYAFGGGAATSVPNGIPWPPRGYVPMALFPDGGGGSPRWSFGYPNADFSTATVTVTVNGSPLAATVVSRTDNGYGDNTLVWELPAGYAVVKGATYNVTVAGIAGATAPSYSYQILSFDPADPPPTVALSVTRSGTATGTVSSSPAAITCGATCTAQIAGGSTVMLTATPAGGSVFAGWGGACGGVGTCTVPMNAAASVDAKFIPTATGLSLNPTPIAFGGQSMATTSPVQKVALVNSGSTAQAITSISVNNAQFAQTNDCPASLAGGAGCTVTLTFTPTVASGPLLSTTSVAGSVAVTATNSTSLALSGTGEKSLVSHYYRSILGRAPDAGGKSFWEGESVRVNNLGANVNEAWFALAITFFNSAEYLAVPKNDTQFATGLYTTFYNRAPDSSGLSFWVGQLGSGLPREVLLAQFMFSAEFAAFTQGIFGNTTVRAEVNTVVDFYRGLLGRLPDDSGFNFWKGQFQAAQCQGAGAVTAQADSISSAFVNSGEYGARGRTNAQYVGDLYNAFLRRGGDLAGVQFWIGELDSFAESRDEVRQAFVASPEFQARVSAIIAQGCGG